MATRAALVRSSGRPRAHSTTGPSVSRSSTASGQSGSPGRSRWAPVVCARRRASITAAGSARCRHRARASSSARRAPAARTIGHDRPRASRAKRMPSTGPNSRTRVAATASPGSAMTDQATRASASATSSVPRSLRAASSASCWETSSSITAPPPSAEGARGRSRPFRGGRVRRGRPWSRPPGGRGRIRGASTPLVPVPDRDRPARLAGGGIRRAGAGSREPPHCVARACHAIAAPLERAPRRRGAGPRRWSPRSAPRERA